jgi:hypothetical protein
MSTVWTAKDLLSGACDLDDVGREKAPLVTPAPEPFHVEDVPAKRLRRDVMKVYHQLGGHTYLHEMATKDPAQFNKLLMKVLPQTIEADVRAEVATQDVRNIPTNVLKQMIYDHLEARTIDVTPTEATADSPTR